MALAYSYIRFSTADQAHGDSKRRQLALTESYCARKNLRLDDALRMQDEGYSAFHGDHIADGALGAFVHAVREGRIPRGSTLILEELSRLTREKFRVALRLFIDIIDAGITIVTLCPEREYNQESCNDISGLMEPLVHLSRAWEESKLKSERIRASWTKERRMAAKGRHPGWLRQNEDGTGWLVDEEKADVVRRIYQLCVNGWGITKIVCLLNAEGVPTQDRAKKWSSGLVSHLLRSRCVLGEAVPLRGRSGSRLPDGEPFKRYPAIMDEALFYGAKEARRSRMSERGPNGPAVRSLFKGLLKDAKTGFSMRVSRDPRNPGRTILRSAARHEGLRTGSGAFPLAVVETAFLGLVRELRLEDISDGLPALNEAEVMTGRLEEIDGKIGELKDRTKGARQIGPLLDLIEHYDKERTEVKAALERAKMAATAGPASTAAATAKDLLRRFDKEANHDERIRLRLLIAAAIKRLVGTIWIWVGERRIPREGVMQVVFLDGTCRVVHMWSDGRAVTHDGPPFPLTECGRLGDGGLSGLADVVFDSAESTRSAAK